MKLLCERPTAAVDPKAVLSVAVSSTEESALQNVFRNLETRLDFALRQDSNHSENLLNR